MKARERSFVVCAMVGFFLINFGIFSGRLWAGEITRQVWTGISGTNVSDLTNQPDYPANPDIQDTLSSMEAPTDWADNYGTRIAGYLHPAVTGDYTFWIASDDGSELWLSTDDSTTNVVKIAYVNGWTNSRQWDKYSSQQSAVIHLEAGQSYFIEALQKEGGGGDNLAVAWQGPGITRQVIDGAYLSPLTGDEQYPPRAADDFISTDPNTAITWQVTLNDSDPNPDDTITISALDPNVSNGGTLIDAGNGSVTYTPAPYFTGLDSFRYTITDGNGGYSTATVHIAVNKRINFAASRNQILSGVSAIGKPGIPGNISVFGKQAFGLVYAGDYEPFLGAAGLGRGRIIAGGHGGYASFNMAQGRTDDTAQFFLNCTAWASGKSGKSVHILTNITGTRDWLQSQGFTNVIKHSGWENYLDGQNLLIISGNWHMTRKQSTALFNFIASGGGLIIGEGGWILQGYGHYALPDAPENIMLRPAGLAFASGYGGSTDMTHHCSDFTNVLTAIDVVQNPGNYNSDQKDEAIAALDLVLSVLPQDDPTYQAIFNTVIDRARQLTPTPSHGISDSVDKLALRWESDYIRQLPLDEITAHRTAVPVYGAVPDDAPRVTRTVSFDITKPAVGTHGTPFGNPWYSTGLYAAPGEIITLTVDPNVVGMGLKVKINGDKDNISGRPSYLRMPFGISREFALDKTTVRAGDAYGGLIFIVVPHDVVTGPFHITISNAVEAPYFVLGRDTDQEWINSIRNKPAPWAELECPNLIISVPSSTIRNLDKPEELMTTYNNGVAAEDDLSGETGLRTRPERAYYMTQTVAGSGYASYPIGTWQWDLANYDKLTGGRDWGEFHELGHLHQQGWWTDGRTGEVTVNIFNMCAQETVSKIGRAVGGWGSQWDPASRISMYQSTVSKGGFDGAGLGERLAMYSELRAAFGWDAYKAVYRGYLHDRDNNPSALPSGDQEEWDQWMTRFSRQVGYDLSPFFVSWSYGVSQAAIDSLSALPKWNMVETVDDTFGTSVNTPVQIGNFLANDFSFDGILTLVGVSNPHHGTLTDNGDGTYTYTPDDGFGGEDRFTYTVHNGFGNTFTGNIIIKVTALTDGVVAHWRFDKNSGNIAWDCSGNNRSGTISNAAWTDGIIGKALHFNGSSSKIEFGRGPSLSGKTDFSVSAWIKTSAHSTGIIIQQRNGGWNGEYQFKVNSDGTVNFFLYGGGTQFDFHTTKKVNDNQWHNVVAVRKSGNGYIYIDGGSPAATASGTARNLSSSISVGIGADIRDNNQHFNGVIDDVALWSRALVVQEVQKIYNNGISGLSFDDKAPVFTNDNFSRSDAVEGVAYHGSIAGTATDENICDTLTFSKIAGPAWLMILPDGEIAGMPKAVDIGKNSFTVRVTDKSGLSDEATLNIQVINRYSGRLGLYDFAGFANQWLSTNCGSCGGADLNGDHNVDLYDLVIMSEHWLEADQTGLQAWWAFDDSTGNVAVDSSGNNHFGYLINNPLWQPGAGKVFGALKLDGSNYAEVTGYQGISGSHARTITAWLKTSHNGTFLYWGNNCAGCAWFCQVDGSVLRLGVWGGWVKGSTILTDNKWHHVAIVVPDKAGVGTQDVLLYVDGSLESTSYSSHAINTSAAFDTLIGAYQLDNPTASFNGMLDDVRIYDRALTADEINQLARE